MSPPWSGRFGGLGLRAVLDVNVLVSGLIRPQGPPGLILLALRQGRFEAMTSWALVEELVDVLGRPKLKRYEIDERDVAALLLLLAPALPSVEVDVPIRDPEDAPVVGAALAAEAEVIVSGDADLLEDDELVAWLRHRGIEVLTPAEFLERLPP